MIINSLYLLRFSRKSNWMDYIYFLLYHPWSMAKTNRPMLIWSSARKEDKVVIINVGFGAKQTHF